MIIAPQRITRNISIVFILQMLSYLNTGRQIIHAQADHTERAGKQLIGQSTHRSPFRHVIGHIAHFTVITGIQPLL